MRVPDAAGDGMAKITLAYPDWKEGKVTPVTFKVPIADTEPAPGAKKGLQRDFLRSEHDAVSAIRKLGGEIERDEGDIVTVRLTGPNVNDLVLKLLGKLTEIRSLRLSDSAITDGGLAELKRLKHLEDLDLARTSITDAGLAHVAALERLKKLNVAGTRVTEEATDRLRQELPNLKVSR